MDEKPNFIVISGCSGGGKSTLLDALSEKGFATVGEPGRRIVQAELAGSGAALPWVDMAAFARSALDLARQDLALLSGAKGPVFFDRGVIDAASALAHLGLGDLGVLVGDIRFNARVFLTPPWREIFNSDAERRHGFETAVEEYERLAADYVRLGYEVIDVPKRPVGERVRFIIGHFG